MINIDDLNESYKRISNYLVDTPIVSSDSLNEKLNAKIFLKNEVEQLTGSFKIRGALSALSNLKNQGVKGVVAYSSGNHAQGVSKAAQIFNMHAIIVMPEDAPSNKINKTKANGAEVVLYKRHVESREDIALKIAHEKNYPLVKPFDNEDIIAGQGSFGLEACKFFKTNNIKPDIVLSCTSGGGLVAGTSIAFKHYFPDVEIYPVEFIVRNVATGSLTKKLGIADGTILSKPLLEYSYKNDDFGDPLIAREHILEFKWVPNELHLDLINSYCLRINDFMQGMFRGVGIKLVDFKLEFGVANIDGKNEILLADEISPDTCRLWDVVSEKKLDKDRFRKDLGNIIQAYQEVARRLGIVHEEGNISSVKFGKPKAVNIKKK